MGKTRLPLVWYPTFSANRQASTNPKPLMVDIAEEPPRQFQSHFKISVAPARENLARGHMENMWLQS
jgi:hypothetical protein